MSDSINCGNPIPVNGFDEFLAACSPAVREIAHQLRELVLQAAPGILEQFDPAARLIGYGFSPTYKDTICVIMPLKAGVNFGFPKGASLPDPHGLLTGTGKRARHVRIDAAGHIDRPALQDLLTISIALIRGQETNSKEND